MDPERHGTEKQQGSVAFQRGDHRAIPMKVTSKKTEIQQAAQATYSATKKQKTSTYFTTASLANELSEVNLMRLNQGIGHHPVPLDQADFYGKCCVL